MIIMASVCPFPLSRRSRRKGGLDWTGLDWAGRDWTGRDWTGRDATRASGRLDAGSGRARDERRETRDHASLGPRGRPPVLVSGRASGRKMGDADSTPPHHSQVTTHESPLLLTTHYSLLTTHHSPLTSLLPSPLSPLPPLDRETDRSWRWSHIRRLLWSGMSPVTPPSSSPSAHPRSAEL
jgi:hypothetical protein